MLYVGMRAGKSIGGHACLSSGGQLSVGAHALEVEQQSGQGSQCCWSCLPYLLPHPLCSAKEALRSQIPPVVCLAQHHLPLVKYLQAQ